MTPAVMERLAERLRPWRLWLAVGSLGSFAGAVLAERWVGPGAHTFTPLSLGTWGFFCISYWFDPVDGVEQGRSAARRWFGAIFVTFFIASLVALQVAQLL